MGRQRRCQAQSLGVFQLSWDRAQACAPSGTPSLGHGTPWPGCETPLAETWEPLGPLGGMGCCWL